MPRPIVIDLFAGAGGFGLGFEQGGFDVVAAVEIDPVHAATHKFNFPECTTMPRSVIGLSGREIRKKCRIGSSRIDVVIGGAPCQGFSLMGQRALDDPRNRLVKEFVRIVCELKAEYFVFENVKGLTVGKHRKIVDELISEFESSGYSVLLPWEVLNAANYGVPQSRQRLFLIGARGTNDLPKYPTPITCESASLLDGLPYAPTCEEALSDIPDADSFSELLESDSVKTLTWGTPSEFAMRMRCAEEGGWGYGYRRKWDSTLLTSSMRTKHTQISIRRFSRTAGGTVEPISRFFRLPRVGVSNTLRAGTDSARGAFTSPRPIHYVLPRCITVREMARLHGFPDWFRFHRTKWHGARQVGNAVPPPLACAIATQILRAIGSRRNRPKREVALGDQNLLKMGMSEASRFWGVEVPISKRDRKSDAKKRKQEDIERGFAESV